MPMNIESIYSVKLPADSCISTLYKSTHLHDAYMTHLNSDVVAEPEALARFMFSQQAVWVSALMTIREIFVGLFGLETSSRKLLGQTSLNRTGRIHYFNIYSSNELEVILGANDKHLDFRLSLLYRKADEINGNVPQLIISTVVNCHNTLGHIYLFVIAPFHRMVVRSGLRRSHKAGWPHSKTT